MVRALDGQLQSLLERVHVATKGLGDLLHFGLHRPPVRVCPGSWNVAPFIVRMVGDCPLHLTNLRISSLAHPHLDI